MIGRYGGDEFVVVMMRCDKQTAEQRMQDAIASLKQIAKNGHPYTFSFGVAQESEIPTGAPTERITALIELADQRMFQQKKKRRISSYSKKKP